MLIMNALNWIDKMTHPINVELLMSEFNTM